MGRPKTYNRDAVAKNAMELFWEQGYAATTTKELAAHMGINTYSLFAEFTSKHGLFTEVMRLYTRNVVTAAFGRLESDTAGLADLKNAQQSGHLRPEADPLDTARNLTATVVGLSVFIRARVDPDVVLGAVRGALQALERLRV